MSTPKTTLFHKGDQIKLKKSKQCYGVGTTTIVTVRPKFLLTFVRKSGDWNHFKVSYNGKYESLTAKNKSIIRISDVSFEALKYTRKAPTL